MFNEYGRIEYYIVNRPSHNWIWSYSAKSLQDQLCALILNHKLKSIMVGLDGYLESKDSSTNVVDLSYMGGITLLIFEKIVIELAIHVEGMFEYRVYPRWDLRMKTTVDFPPDDMVFSNKYFYDISNHDITFKYINQPVKKVLSRGTDTWGFSVEGFDESLAEKAIADVDLPAEINLVLENKTFIRFVGDSIEYYRIGFEEAK